jgi:hypothetical protein
MHVNRIVQDGAVQHRGVASEASSRRLGGIESPFCRPNSLWSTIVSKPANVVRRCPIVKACAETPRRAVRFKTEEPTTAAKRHRTEGDDDEAGGSTPPILHEEPRTFDEVGWVCCAFRSKEQRMKFLKCARAKTATLLIGWWRLCSIPRSARIPQKHQNEYCHGHRFNASCVHGSCAVDFHSITVSFF